MDVTSQRKLLDRAMKIQATTIDASTNVNASILRSAYRKCKSPDFTVARFSLSLFLPPLLFYVSCVPADPFIFFLFPSFR